MSMKRYVKTDRQCRRGLFFSAPRFSGFLLLAAVLPAFLFSSCGGRCGENERFAVNSNTLRVQNVPGGHVKNMAYETSVVEIEDGEKKICLCRALAFRMAQIIAARDGQSVLRSHQIQRIETGWATPEIKEVLGEVFRVPGKKIILRKRGASSAGLEIQDNWFIIEMTGGEKYTLRGTEALYSRRFLKLRAALKKGKKNLYLAESIKERKKVEDRLRRLPFNGLLKIEVN